MVLLDSLWSEASLSALAVAVLVPPQAVKLTEVHVGRNPARLIGLRRLAASLAEQAPVPRAGAGALSLRVGGLQGGGGALTAGERRAVKGRRTCRVIGECGRAGDEGGDGGWGSGATTAE